jgi:hypothetical protein
VELHWPTDRRGDGRIVAAGYTANRLDTEFALMRINP